MPKQGRPPLEPRIAALEAQVLELQQCVEVMTKAIAERKEPVAYRSHFDKWPSSVLRGPAE